MIILIISATSMSGQTDDDYRMEIGGGLGLTGYLGDFNGANRHEFSTASNSIDDIIEVFKSYDQQEGVVEVIIRKRKK